MTIDLVQKPEAIEKYIWLLSAGLHTSYLPLIHGKATLVENDDSFVVYLCDQKLAS